MEERLSWAGEETAGTGIPRGIRQVSCGTVIPSITHMFPKRAQRES